MNRDAFLTPDPYYGSEKIALLRPISAIQLIQDESGHEKLGLLSQLGPGVMVERCGAGFSEGTVKVRANGHCYFVFLQDLESQAAKASA
jgi:hypothetical protein